MIRIDLLLTERQLAKSRSQAQTFISEGRVSFFDRHQWITISKPSFKVTHDCQIHVTESDADRYVSRGALKLEGALNHTQLDIKGFTVLDVGQSTGGFTDCALQHGAQKVVGIEVGHDQLDPRLKQHPDVICLEGVNARHLTADILSPHMPETGFDLAVMDVSFISQTKILPNLVPLLAEDGQLISLVKPQFEVGPQGIGKGGIVKDPQLFKTLQQELSHFVEALGLTVKTYMESPITGGDGNHEFLLWAKKA